MKDTCGITGYEAAAVVAAFALLVVCIGLAASFVIKADKK